MMEVGRMLLRDEALRVQLTLHREWAQRVKPSDNLIVKDA